MNKLSPAAATRCTWKTREDISGNTRNLKPRSALKAL